MLYNGSDIVMKLLVMKLLVLSFPRNIGKIYGDIGQNWL